MTKQEKKLLIDDLCARLRYGVKARYFDSEEGREDWRTKAGILAFHEDNDWIDIVREATQNKEAEKLTTEQKLYIARLGSMRVLTLKKKVVSLENIVRELNEEVVVSKEEIV